MKILVTGADGSLASAVIPHLIKDNEIIVSDLSDNNIDNPIYFPDLKHIEPKDIVYLIKRKEIDRVLHCAEENTINNYFETRVIYNNVYVTAEILEACAKSEIPCIVPTWGEFCSKKEDTILSTSINYKNKICSLYNIGNAVISTIVIPRIIYNKSYVNIYGNLVGRFFNFYSYGSMFLAAREEIGISSYIDIDTVINYILLHINKKTRNCTVLYGYKCDDITLLSWLLYVCKVPFIDLYGGHQTLTITAPNELPLLTENRDIEKIINKEFIYNEEYNND